MPIDHVGKGGMPFIFAEAVSVEISGVMADIPVSHEIIRDVEVARRALFEGPTTGLLPRWSANT